MGPRLVFQPGPWVSVDRAAGDEGIVAAGGTGAVEEMGISGSGERVNPELVKLSAKAMAAVLGSVGVFCAVESCFGAQVAADALFYLGSALALAWATCKT